jgi:hypothetical protein
VGAAVTGATVGAAVNGAIVGAAVNGAIVGGGVTGATVGVAVTGAIVGIAVTGAKVGVGVTGATVGEAVNGAIDGAIVGGGVIGATVASEINVGNRVGDLVGPGEGFLVGTAGAGVGTGASKALSQQPRKMPLAVGQQFPFKPEQPLWALQLSMGTTAGAAVTVGIVQSISEKLYSTPLLHVNVKS